MAAGVAVMQPALPALVRRWAPSRIGLATAVFTNGLLVGEIFPVALTEPLVFQLAGAGWRASLAAWSAPVAVTALLVAAFAPPVPDEPAGAAGARRGRPAWRSGLIWTLGLLFGSINALYFATNAFLPGLLGGRGRPDLIGPALTALNAGQLPAAFLMLGLAGRLERRGAPFVWAALLALAALTGMLASSGAAVVAWAALLGFANSGALILALALPALLRAPDEVAATSAAMFTISYGGALVLALASGAAWDLAGDPRAAFGPVCGCAVSLGGAALALRSRGRLR
jgi:CP family cyanate transporter-like MFS transporter